MLLLEDETGGRLDTKPVELVRADVLFARGDLDGALRIRREEQLPVYERLGGRDLVIGWVNLALMLLTRDSSGDREEARGLLCLALADARRMRLPEAAHRGDSATV